MIGGPAITGYSVQRWNSDTNTWDEIATPAHIGSATQDQTYPDPGRTPGTTYYYRVAAVNSQGTGKYTAYDDAPILCRRCGRANTDGDRYRTAHNRAHLEHPGR